MGSWDEIQSVKKNESVAKRWYLTVKEVQKKSQGNARKRQKKDKDDKSKTRDKDEKA